MVLHTVNKSPAHPAMAACLAMAAADDGLLLLEDGVFCALDTTANRALLAGREALSALYVLAPDLEARGLRGRTLLPGVELVDHAGFVALCTRHQRVQHWF